MDEHTDVIKRAGHAVTILKARGVSASLAILRKEGEAAGAAPAETSGDLTGAGLVAGGGQKEPQQGSGTGSKRPAHAVMDYQGIPVHVDRPRGTIQKGTDEKGDPWGRVYHVDYGYIPNTRGGDDHNPAMGKDGQLDVFLGLWPESKEAHWVLQKKADGTFDEYKVMLGFTDADSARGMYQAHVPKRFFGSMTSTSVEMMKALLGLRPAEVMKTLKALGELGGVAAPAPADSAATLKVADAAFVERVVPFRVLKDADGGELRYLLGFVLVPDVVDSQGDIYDKAEVRKAAWNYMAKFRNVGLMHKGLVNGKVDLVESFCAPCQMTVQGSDVPEGTWMMGLRVNDDGLWGDVKEGRLTGLSIGGFATKQPIK